ncbi:MAG: hypothetical protein Q7J54_05020 [Candidatus Woesearchaeota archaeon]|nr:hypothetical protein [Candidatus Woesearchaeota archaeon]
MKVLYEGKETEIRELPEGRYMPRLPCYNCATPPLISRDNLGERIRKLGYDKFNINKNEVVVEVQGPFQYLHISASCCRNPR